MVNSRYVYVKIGKQDGKHEIAVREGFAEDILCENRGLTMFIFADLEKQYGNGCYYCKKKGNEELQDDNVPRLCFEYQVIFMRLLLL